MDAAHEEQMELPRQVRDAEKRSNDAIDAIKAERAGVAATTDQPPADPPPDPTAAPPSEQQPKDTGREDWKTKYLVLQGKYNAEVPRLSADVRAANARIEELNAEVGRLKAGAEQPNAQPQAAQDQMGMEVPDEIRELLGEDTINAIKRIAASEAGKQIAPLKEKADAAAATAEQVSADRAATARERFMDALSARVPNYQQIDARDDWKQWLAQIDPMARRQRQEILTEAAQALDVEGVAIFFEAFSQVAGIKSGAVKGGPPAHMEAPPQAGKSSVPAVDKRSWTKAQMAQAYKDMALNKYTREEAAKLDAELVAAAREGRVKD
jgi:hypothetical protein